MLDEDAWKKGGSVTAPPLVGHSMYFDKSNSFEHG